MTYDVWQWNNETHIDGLTYNTCVPNLRDMPPSLVGDTNEKESLRGANMKRMILPCVQQATKQSFLHFVKQATYIR